MFACINENYIKIIRILHNSDLWLNEVTINFYKLVLIVNLKYCKFKSFADYLKCIIQFLALIYV